MRTFDTGATRDSDDGKFDYEGFLSPLVLERYAEYMHLHRKQAGGKLRDSDNWQKGIPIAQYCKSLWRHFVDIWTLHRGWPAKATLEDALCAVLFNAMGMLHEVVKKRLAAVSPESDSRCAVYTHPVFKPKEPAPGKSSHRTRRSLHY